MMADGDTLAEKTAKGAKGKVVSDLGKAAKKRKAAEDSDDSESESDGGDDDDDSDDDSDSADAAPAPVVDAKAKAAVPKTSDKKSAGTDAKDEKSREEDALPRTLFIGNLAVTVKPKAGGLLTTSALLDDESLSPAPRGHGLYEHSPWRYVMRAYPMSVRVLVLNGHVRCRFECLF